jgi:hypothetical protein
VCRFAGGERENREEQGKDWPFHDCWVLLRFGRWDVCARIKIHFAEGEG